MQAAEELPRELEVLKEFRHHPYAGPEAALCAKI